MVRLTRSRSRNQPRWRILPGSTKPQISAVAPSLIVPGTWTSYMPAVTTTYAVAAPGWNIEVGTTVRSPTC